MKIKLFILLSLLLPTLSFAAPTISITSYSNRQITGTTNLAPTITEPENVTKVIYKIDDSILSEVTSSPFNYSLDTNTLSNGPHKLTVNLIGPSTDISTSVWFLSWNTNKVSENSSRTVVSGKTKITQIPIDSNIAMVTKGAEKFFYLTFGSSKLGYPWYKYSGNFNNPFAKQVWKKVGHQLLVGANKPKATGPYEHYWLLNTYQNANEVLGFVHVEEHDDTGEDKFYHGAIALAYSKDYGDTWKYLGKVLIPKYKDESGNPLGTPYFIKDGYIYLYNKEAVFNGGSTKIGAIVVSRAKLNEVMAAARLGQNVPWQKYFNGDWASPGIGGEASPLMFTSVEGHDHTDAVYSTYTGKYYMLSATIVHNTSTVPAKIKMFESIDGIHWTLIKVIDSTVPVQTASTYTGYNYVSIFNQNGTDSSVAGRYFYIFGGLSKATASNMEIYRWLVDLGSNEIVTPPATTSTSTTTTIIPHIFSQEYSSTQGKNSWFYQYRGTAAYANMVWDAANNRWKGNELYSIIQTLGMHPGAKVSVAKVWRANSSDQIKLTGNIVDGNSQCGDGVVAKIFKNGSLLWQRTIANGNTTGFTYNLNTSVVPGDAIYHEIFAGSDNGCDSTAWNPEVDIIKTN